MIELINSGLVGLHMKGKLADDFSAVCKNQLKLGRRSVLGVHWKDWCWSWNSNTLATSCEELTHWKRPWCWEALGAGGEGDDRGWHGWMASPTWWTWVWVNSGSWWWTGRPGVLGFMGSQRVGYNWATELNWTELGGLSLQGQQSLKVLQDQNLEDKKRDYYW